MDNLFNLECGATSTLHEFCNALHRTHLGSSQFGIVSIQHRKRLSQYDNLQYEFLVLDVVPLIPGTNTPQANGPHTYIEVIRTGDRARAPTFGIWGFARDEVLVLQQDDEPGVVQQENPSQGSQYCAGDHLSTLSWSNRIPNILDVFSVITLLSLTFPQYNIFTHRCFSSWFARAIYLILRQTYAVHFEDTMPGGNPWERARFFIFVRAITPTPPAVISEFCYHQRVWRELQVAAQANTS